MAKNNKDNKRGLGRGLDSLIPKIDDIEEEKAKRSSLTLEDILSNSEEENKAKDTSSEEKVNEAEKELAKEIEEIEKEVARKEEDIDVITEELVEEKAVENYIEEAKKKAEKSEKSEKAEEEGEEEKVLSDYELASIEEVKEIIEKNPRITLWSTKSSAVFRYLRKTRPEFSISKEASELVDQAVSEKYPEIWKLFEDL